MKKKVNLLEGPIHKQLLVLLVPQLFGFFAVTGFNFADSWFVSQLDNTLPPGHESLYLSSISMTFPVVFGVGCIAIGLGIAVTTLISRAHGGDNRELAQRYARDSLLLVIIITAIVTTIGLNTIDELFTFMGARPEQLPLIRTFMTIWYHGAVMMLVPMTCNNILRGYGNTFVPGVVMITGALINVILDPIMIFGFAGVPAMGVAGAAWATVISRCITAIISISALIKFDLLTFKMPRFSQMIKEWGELIYYAFPGILGRVTLPVSLFMLNSIAAKFGKNAVAAINAGGRIEQVMMVAAMALAIVLMIYVSQNLAGGKVARARKAINFSYKMIICYMIFGVIGVMLFSEQIAQWFNKIPQVQIMTREYLLVVPFAYFLCAVGMIAQQCFFAIKKPMLSGLTDVFRYFVVVVPSAWIGSLYYGFSGMIAGITIGVIFSFGITVYIFEREYRKHVAVIELRQG